MHVITQGLNISLGTDDPLQFHSSTDPLLEEYTIAAKAWGLTNSDLCEIASMSVKMSGFPARCKAEWLGAQYHNPLPTLANDPDRSNLPTSRVMYRKEALGRELTLLAQRIGAEGTVRVGRHVVDLDIERQIHAHTRKLHDIFNTLYYDVPMREEDPDGTWCGTPKNRPNTRWAGGDGKIDTEQDDMHTPRNRLAQLDRARSKAAALAAFAGEGRAVESGPVELVAAKSGEELLARARSLESALRPAKSAERFPPAVSVAPGEAADGGDEVAEAGVGGFLAGCAVGAAGALAVLIAMKRLK